MSYLMLHFHTCASFPWPLLPCLISNLEPSTISLNLMLDIISQTLDLTSLVGPTFSLLEMKPHPKIYSNTEETVAGLLWVPIKWLTTIDTKSKGSD